MNQIKFGDRRNLFQMFHCVMTAATPALSEKDLPLDKQKEHTAVPCTEKKRKAEIQSYLLGVLHPNLITDDLVQAAEAHIAKANKLQRERANKQALIRRKVTQKEAWTFELSYFSHFCFTF